MRPALCTLAILAGCTSPKPAPAPPAAEEPANAPPRVVLDIQKLTGPEITLELTIQNPGKSPVKLSRLDLEETFFTKLVLVDPDGHRWYLMTPDHEPDIFDSRHIFRDPSLRAMQASIDVAPGDNICTTIKLHNIVLNVGLPNPLPAPILFYWSIDEPIWPPFDENLDRRPQSTLATGHGYMRVNWPTPPAP
jgi:hypothetical protein